MCVMYVCTYVCYVYMYVIYVCLLCCAVLPAVLCCTPSFTVLYSQLCCAVLSALLCCTLSYAHAHAHTHYILFILFLSHVPLVPFFQRQSWISAWMARLSNQQGCCLKAKEARKEKHYQWVQCKALPTAALFIGTPLMTHTVCSTAELLCSAVTV